MSGALSLAADIMVAVLLVATIVTSVRLSRRIARLKADESSMRKTIGDLVAATDSAERAVTGLRTTLLECDRALAERIGAAERQEEGLARTIKAGEAVMGGIGHIVDSTRRAVQAPARPLPEPARMEAGGALKHALAAAQAVADRASRRVGNRAA
jgi:hypothetical protein